MNRFNVGDKLKIREWDDMVSEFGTDKDGDIRNGFVQRMRYLCGKTFTVSAINGDAYHAEEVGYSRYWISASMLESLKDEELYIASEEELNKLLESV